jgi:hypothetical protein
MTHHPNTGSRDSWHIDRLTGLREWGPLASCDHCASPEQAAALEAERAIFGPGYRGRSSIPSGPISPTEGYDLSDPKRMEFNR